MRNVYVARCAVFIYAVSLTRCVRETFQAEEAGDRLAAQIGGRPVLCFVSPYTRTRQTADAVLSRLAAAGVRVLRRQEDPRLREREFCGTFQREEPQREDEWSYSRFFWRPTSGESCDRESGILYCIILLALLLAPHLRTRNEAGEPERLHRWACSLRSSRLFDSVQRERMRVEERSDSIRFNDYNIR
jgi:hypothetical protein